GIRDFHVTGVQTCALPIYPQPADCRRLEIKWPILTNEEFAKVRRMDLPGLKVGILPMLFRVTRGEKGLVKSMEEIRLMARRLIRSEERRVGERVERLWESD